MTSFNNRKLDASQLLQIINAGKNAIAIYTSDDLVIEAASDAMIAFWGKDRSIIGQPLEEAVPELNGQPFKQMLISVLRTGVTDSGIIPATTLIGQNLQTAYYEYEYRAVKDTDGKTYAIIHTAADVTDRESSRLALERATTTLQQAIDSANIGTWSVDFATDELTISRQARLIHGIPEGKQLKLIDSLEMIVPEHRDIVAQHIRKAMDTGENFYNEYIIEPMDESPRKWLRATGKVSFKDKQAVGISGTMIDISEQKKDDERKNDFIGMVSHELKTPLTTLNAVIQVSNAKLKNSPDSFLAGAMAKAEAQVRKMSKMINGFLNVSRLESGKILIEKEVFNLEGLMDEIIDELTVTTKNHVIHFDACGELPVNADREKIGSVISNLLSNAIKYSPGKKLIDVSCLKKAGKLIVCVRDYGLGVKREDIEKLFDRYYRVQSSTTQNISGFGIGLYLSAEIVRRHDGEIWVESEYGQGSTFYFSLPL